MTERELIGQSVCGKKIILFRYNIYIKYIYTYKYIFWFPQQKPNRIFSLTFGLLEKISSMTTKFITLTCFVQHYNIRK